MNSHTLGKEKRLIIVGGTGRNVGKTEFACRLIAQLAQSFPVYGLKVSAVYPDEQIYHGSHDPESERLCLVEETRTDGTKDTMRMLNAGAARVFYLKGEQESVLTGFQEFITTIPEKSAIVCESNSLSEYITPAMHIIVHIEGGEVKPRAVSLLHRADMVIVSDGTSGFEELSRIRYEKEKGWYLR